MRSIILFAPGKQRATKQWFPLVTTAQCFWFICAVLVEKKDIKVLLKIVAREVCALPVVCLAVLFPAGRDLLISSYLA